MNPSSIQPYDIFMLVVIGLATAFGIRKGMAWQLASLASLIVSAVVAVRFHPVLAPYVSSDPTWNRYIAMLILYLGTSLAIWIGFRLVAGIIDRVKLQGFDHQAGGVFGFAKGVLLCLVITFFAVTLSEWARQIVLKTYSGHYIAVLLEKGTPMLPEEVRSVLGTYIQQMEGKLAPDGPPSPDLSPDSAIPDALQRRLAPNPSPGGNPGPLYRPPSPPASIPPPVAQPRDSQPPAYQPPAFQQPNDRPLILQPRDPQPPVFQPQPPPQGNWLDEPAPKGMQRVE